MAGKLAKAKAGLKRAHGHAKSGMARAKPVAIGIGTGAAIGYIDDKLTGSVDMLRKNWYAVPAVLAVGSFALSKKSPAAAGAMAGVAGYMGYIKYQLSRAVNTPGYEDTGAPQQITDGGVTLDAEGVDAEEFDEVYSQ